MDYPDPLPSPLRNYKPRPNPGTPKCFNCMATEGVTEEHFCSGCGVYICDECEGAEDMPWGNHGPEEHVLPENLRTEAANTIIALIRAEVFPDEVLWVMRSHPDTDPFVKTYLDDLDRPGTLLRSWEDHIQSVIHSAEKELGWSECNGMVRILKGRLTW